MYVEKPGFYLFFSINYAKIYKKFIEGRGYGDADYIYCSSILSAIITDINSKSDYHSNFIKTKLRQLPNYGNTEHNEVLLFFNIISHFYDVEKDAESTKKTYELCYQQRERCRKYLKTFFDNNKQFRIMMDDVSGKTDKVLNETLIAKHYQRHSCCAEIIENYKLFNFYSDFLSGKK